jgi:hypothetical protein
MRDARSPKAVKNAALSAAMLALALPTVTFAQGGPSVTAGFDYTTGTYGAATATQAWYYPVTVRYEHGTMTYQLTVPYLRMSGPANVVGVQGTELEVHPGMQHTPGMTPPERTASGLGDVIAGATYNLYWDGAAGLLVDTTGKIKFGTADDTTGLGTGKNDYSIQGDVVKVSGGWTAFGNLGWRKMGDPAGVDLKDQWFASLGVGYLLAPETQVGAAYDFRQRVIEGGPDLGELTVFVTRKLSAHWKIQGYLLKGFTSGSADRGGGAMLQWSY